MTRDRREIPPPPPEVTARSERLDPMMEMARHIGRLADAQERSAAAMERQADATLLLARATAGEFDEAPTPLEPSPKGQGMGMQG